MGDYATLLSTLSATRADLERMTTRANALEAENSTLHKNYEALKATHTHTQQMCTEARENYHILAEAKAEQEKRNEEFISRLQSRLDQQLLETEQAQRFHSSAPPAPSQEEIELPLKHKIRSLTEELDHAQVVVAQYKRECDKYKAELYTVSENYKREIASLRTEQEAVAHSLQDQLITLQEERESSFAYGVGASSSSSPRGGNAHSHALLHADTTVRALKQQLLEQAATIEHLKQEVQTLINARDTQTFENMQFRFDFFEFYLKV